jgi:hypothetical protein
MGFPSAPPMSAVISFGLPSSGYYWATSYFDSSIPNWTLTGTGLGVNISYPFPGNLPKLIYRNPTATTFNSKKTYQYTTYVGNFFNSSASFSANTVWGDSIDYSNVDRNSFVAGMEPPSPGNGFLYFYSNPSTNITSNDYVIYKANNAFGLGGNSEALYETRINEIDFDIQGFAWWRDGNSGTQSTAISFSASTDGRGWCYYPDTNSYIWYDDVAGTIFPAQIVEANLYGGFVKARVVIGSASLNYLVKYIDYGKFNLSFTYTKASGSVNDGIDIYLSQEKPSNDYYILNSPQFIPDTAELLASYTQSGMSGSSTFSAYFGLTGKQYLIIKARTTDTSTIQALSNINIEGGYWSGNNRRYLTTNSNLYLNPTSLTPIGLTGATFSAYTGTGNTYNATQSLDVQQIFSKIGNGKFMAGIWENGVWNSGWRYDEVVYELYDIGQYFSLDRGKIWRFQIIGPPLTIEKFNIGDKVSLGNIVAIDFNEDRKLLKGYFTIINKNSNSFVVELINNFPLKRIEKDSPFHRIKITKNVWLSGVFLNGYYTGIWNSGLFKGYPLITEMFDSSWIDGTFDGGHFSSQLYSVTFSNTYFTKGNKLGLSFSQPHKLYTNDLIYIDKDNKGINSSYDGTASVVTVTNEYQIITDKDYGTEPTQSESGSIYTGISTGLVQNFTFKSNNTSKLSSVDYLDSDAVFLYNSWLDVNYYTYSAVNIGRPNTIRNNISLKEYSQNNLYGYPTDDVLSSTSYFRNSYNNLELSYSLGTKYKIFNDYIGEASNFENYFDPTNVDATDFLNLGWTYSSGGLNSIVFSRSIETKAKNISRSGFSYSWTNVREDLLVGSEMQIDAISSGGVLNISEPSEITNFRVSEKVSKSRYTMVEFNLARWSAQTPYYESNDSTISKITTLYKEETLSQPILHFDNLNVVTRDIYYGSAIGTFSTTVNASFFPVYQNVNHILTPVSKKIEYFFNKTNLSMNFRGSGWYGALTASILIDNLKYYEVDMIPFFQYFTTNNINFGIEIPYQGIAPFIDYSNANFQFLDNVSIGLDSFSVNASNVAVSGIGAGIGFSAPSSSGGGIGIEDISGPSVIDLMD